MKPDLAHATDAELIIELFDRGVQADFIIGAYMHMQETRYHINDEVMGSSEAGLHGKGATR